MKLSPNTQEIRFKRLIDDARLVEPRIDLIKAWINLQKQQQLPIRPEQDFWRSCTSYFPTQNSRNTKSIPASEIDLPVALEKSNGIDKVNRKQFIRNGWFQKRMQCV